MPDRDEWDDEVPDDDDDEAPEEDAGDEDDDEGGEDEIALSAVRAWLDIEGDPSGLSELAQAQREALVAIAEEALVMKAQREDRQRREAFSRKVAQREQQREQERAELARQHREAWEKEQARRQREEEYRVAREQEVERQRREDERRAAQERVEARARAERRAVERRAQEDRRVALERVAAAPEPPRQALGDDEIERLDDEADAAEEAPATEIGWEEFEVPAALDEQDDGAYEPKPIPSRPATTRPVALKGADLADWRKRRGLTQQAAADLLGVRQGTVSKAEGRRGAVLGEALQDALAAALRAERSAA